MRLYIKNMVCNRCILVVKQELNKLNIDNCKITLGEVETPDDISVDKKEQLRVSLDVLGFELLDNTKQQLIEKIKNIIVQQVHSLLWCFLHLIYPRLQCQLTFA